MEHASRPPPSMGWGTQRGSGSGLDFLEQAVLVPQAWGSRARAPVEDDESESDLDEPLSNVAEAVAEAGVEGWTEDGTPIVEQSERGRKRRVEFAFDESSTPQSRPRHTTDDFAASGGRVDGSAAVLLIPERAEKFLKAETGEEVRNVLDDARPAWIESDFPVELAALSQVQLENMRAINDRKDAVYHFMLRVAGGANSVLQRAVREMGPPPVPASAQVAIAARNVREASVIPGGGQPEVVQLGLTAQSKARNEKILSTMSWLRNFVVTGIMYYGERYDAAIHDALQDVRDSSPEHLGKATLDGLVLTKDEQIVSHFARLCSARVNEIRIGSTVAHNTRDTRKMTTDRMMFEKLWFRVHARIGYGGFVYAVFKNKPLDRATDALFNPGSLEYRRGYGERSIPWGVSFSDA